MTVEVPGPGGAPARAADGPGSWLTTVLRPTGRLDRAAARALRPALLALAVLPGLVVIDLTAADPVSAEAWRMLDQASVVLDAAGGGLLVTGTDPAAVPAAAGAITVLPSPPRP